MTHTTAELAPTSILPPLGTLQRASAREIFGLLDRLSSVYCPLPAPLPLPLPLPLTLDDVPAPSGLHAASKAYSAPGPDHVVDSGYTSETEGSSSVGGEDEEDGGGGGGSLPGAVAQDASTRIAGLRADPFERSFADRWLAGFLARATTLHSLVELDLCDRAVDQAAYVLESLLAGGAEEPQQQQGGTGSAAGSSDFTHDFSFELPAGVSADGSDAGPVTVSLRDRIAGADSGKDHDDVGLQLWGSSVVFSDLICSSPARFSLDKPSLGPGARIIELGAGTGLVSLVLGTLLPRLGVLGPRVIATDYHPAVLDLLKTNITALGDDPAVETALLDWSATTLAPPFDERAKVLLAADVVYAPEHATLLRDCATRLLAPDGVFWMLNAVRRNGRFEGVDSTVETAFAAADRPAGPDGRVLGILSSERLEKRKGIGRGDESGYRLFQIGWV